MVWYTGHSSSDSESESWCLYLHLFRTVSAGTDCILTFKLQIKIGCSNLTVEIRYAHNLHL
jgi:hypothetical protein